MEEIKRSEAMALLRRVPVGHLGVLTDSGPYVSPLSFAIDGQIVYMRTAPGRRLDALRETPTACLEVTEVDDETGGWVSAIVFGEVTEVGEAEELAHAVELLVAKYRAWISPVSSGAPEALSDLIITIKMQVESISGRASGRWFGATRPGRL